MTIGSGQTALAADLLVTLNPNGSLKNGIVGQANLASDIVFPTVCEGRLTLTSGVPVTTVNVTGATNVYFTPYNGNRISLYTGSAWVLRTFSELTLALGTLTANLPYDVFAYDNNGVVALRPPTAWASATARATALALQNGVPVKSGTPGDRYLGTFYTVSATQTEDSESNRMLWNLYNQAQRPLRATMPAADWTVGTNVGPRAINLNTTAGQGRVNVLVGYGQTFVELDGHYILSACGDARNGIGFGVNSTSAFADTLFSSVARAAVSGLNYWLLAPRARGYLTQVGFNFVQALEATFSGGGMTVKGEATGSIAAPAEFRGYAVC